MKVKRRTAYSNADTLLAFLDDTPRQIEKLKNAAEARDLLVLKAVAHYLRGGSSCIGACRFSELCSQLEGTAENSSIADADTLIKHLETEFAAIQSGK